MNHNSINANSSSTITTTTNKETTAISTISNEYVLQDYGTERGDWTEILFGIDSNPRDITELWLSEAGRKSPSFINIDGGWLVRVRTSSRDDYFAINRVAQSGDRGESSIEGRQIDLGAKSGPSGSVINGGDGDDTIRGYAGWDILFGGDGNDFIRAGNGRDIISGGSGADELHGDFGWNTYTSERDGSRDLIAIKSDQNLSNWLIGKAGNNPNGEKADIIEGLDSFDQIKIIGATTESLSFGNATAHGTTGIGIFADGALEAVYIGGDLSSSQIAAMTTGDASFAAMNNGISSYGWMG